MCCRIMYGWIAFVPNTFIEQLSVAHSSQKVSISVISPNTAHVLSHITMVLQILTKPMITQGLSQATQSSFLAVIHGNSRRFQHPMEAIGATTRIQRRTYSSFTMMRRITRLGVARLHVPTSSKGTSTKTNQ